MTRYKQRTDGEGFFVPCAEVYRIACCDCGLVHDFVFVSEDNKPIGIAARRNKRATAQRRKRVAMQSNSLGKRKEFATYRRTDVVVVGGKFAKQVSEHQVRVMASTEGYAMVRNPGCMPFVVQEKDLAAPAAQPEATSA